MGNVQISNASIIHLVMVMETAVVIRNFANVMLDLVEQTVQLILKVRKVRKYEALNMFDSK